MFLSKRFLLIAETTVPTTRANCGARAPFPDRLIVIAQAPEPQGPPGRARQQMQVYSIAAENERKKRGVPEKLREDHGLNARTAAKVCTDPASVSLREGGRDTRVGARSSGAVMSLRPRLAFSAHGSFDFALVVAGFEVFALVGELLAAGQGK